MGSELGPWAECGEPAIPAGVAVEDGLTEAEAVALALWNNAAFQEVLVELDLTQADVVLAAQLPNPELWLLSPVGVKQLEFAVEWPVDALWLRPRRVQVAELESLRVAETLVQAGLDLIRDVRFAYADALLASERVQVARASEALRRRISSLTEARLRAGDASPVEAATVRIEVQRATLELHRLENDRLLALERLTHVMGVRITPFEFALEAGPLPDMVEDIEALIAAATAERADLRAADWAVAAAQSRRRVAGCEWFSVRGIADANGQGRKGFEIGPGFRMTLPIFHQNQGRIARADAEIELAIRRRASLRSRVEWETRQAHLQLTQARAELGRWQTELRPAVVDTIGKAERAYREGDLALIAVLESSRQALDMQSREAQLRANVRRAAAELERSVGRRLAPPAPTGLPGGLKQP